MIEINCKCGHKIACEDNASKHKISALKSYYGKHVCLKCSSENTVAYPTKLKRMMGKSGMPLSSLSRKTGISASTLSLLASGRENINSLAAINVIKLADALGADIADVLNDGCKSARQTNEIKFIGKAMDDNELLAKVKKYAEAAKQPIKEG